ncbi:TetR/AcrR family transcriptional regulator [Curtobacterium flaccumfaciens]|uniref:TetR/AcrR family transcriptional regulator n=1 Tax=Curtobacterium flaccumfaciens TaxID=2035 RepID=UPI001BDEDF1B|nr:TetR/AcrR family transcriptional regulator [Curtobacterium flaccumfaciens]MBT1606599.1 TetR/AcrR family transcriptional regulator [Curtobacterium flaccumfaciens pv. betae]MBT1655821.1 TetR/AcrR family transcriptional regulator [Curtobacterium flaccumfaciens pv. betae]MCS0471589.1 TetR/AcrR family transcriptional regulator [Curtobacterium flaccumfaciens pv. betae]MCS0473344.1 TetR/AcrR family transcriptional regulator [Curtobacterium flaccumfaciens pv. betae]MCS0477967.1 TetR/AcrR family tra
MTTTEQPSRAPRRDATENRAALLDAAKTCLQQDPDASIETIAASAGLSRRAVYGHFPSRDDLVREVVTAGAARIAAAMPTTSDLQELPPAARLAAIAVTLWSEVSHVRSMARVAVRSPFAEPVAEVFAPLRSQVRQACALGIADGAMRDDVDPETLGRLVEGACIAVLDEATRSGTSDEDGRRMVVVSALGMAGIDWRTALLSEPAAPAPAPAPASAPKDHA